MIAEHVRLILYVTGAVTLSMVFQFLAPRTYLRLSHGLVVDDPRALFFARHWGLVVALFGILLIWAGHEPALRIPVMATAAIGKAVLVVMILTNLKSFTKGYWPVAVFDTLCALLYVLYLAGL